MKNRKEELNDWRKRQAMILVTGSTGLVGSHIVEQLIREGRDVRVLVRGASRLDRLKKVMQYYRHEESLPNDKILVQYGDILDKESLDRALRGVDEIYHSAGFVSFNPSMRHQVQDVNVLGTRNMVNAALEHGIRKFGFVSSVAALSHSGGESLITETSFWNEPVFHSMYAKSKFNAELEVWRGVSEGLNAIVISPSVILGPGDWHSGSSSFFHEIWKGLNYYTTGVTGFVDVTDVASALLSLMRNAVVNERFIVSSENWSFHELFSAIARHLGIKSPKYQVSEWMLQVGWRLEKIRSTVMRREPLITKETALSARDKVYYSNEKLKKTLGYEFMPVMESVARNCRFFLMDHNNPFH